MLTINRVYSRLAFHQKISTSGANKLSGKWTKYSDYITIYRAKENLTLRPFYQGPHFEKDLNSHNEQRPRQGKRRWVQEQEEANNLSLYILSGGQGRSHALKDVVVAIKALCTIYSQTIQARRQTDIWWLKNFAIRIS